MQTYLSTFVSGLQEPVEFILKKDIPNVKILSLLDGLIVYETETDAEKIGFRCFNNSFLVMKQFSNLGSNPINSMFQIVADSKGLVYQIYFNPLGSVFDQKISVSPEAGFDADRTWNGTYEVKTIKGSDFWSIEVRIPLNQFEFAIKSGQKWGLNFRRKQKRFNSSADWQVPITYDPETYGYLIMK